MLVLKSGQCGDQQRCKHELTSEKAYLNQVELGKLKSVFYELRFNLIKNGLVSAQFCTRLAKCKLESYLKDFVDRYQTNFFNSDLNTQLKVIIDILFYFYRKQNKQQQMASNSTGAKNQKQKNGANGSSASKSAAAKANIYYEVDDTEESINSAGVDTSGVENDETKSPEKKPNTSTQEK